MSVELIKDLLKLDQIIEENISQAIVEGDILVPDTKPDITRVLTADARVDLNKQKIGENNISIEGTVYFKILYVSDKGQQALYSVDSSTEFKENIEIENIHSQMKSEVELEVEHTDFTVNNERKIGVKAVINLTSRCIEEKTVEITKDITGLEDIQVLRESFNYTDIIGINESETLVKDHFELDQEEFEIREVLKWDATAIEDETKITDGKVIVSGRVKIGLLYVDEEYNKELKVIKRELPFTHFVEIADAFSDMEYNLRLSVRQLYYDIKENLQEERKIVELEAVVGVEAKVLDTQTKEIVVDTYWPGRQLEITRDQVELKENIGIGKLNVLIRETLDTPQGHPPISQLLSVNINPILTDFTTMEDNLIVEGILEARVMYKAIEGIQPLYSFTQEVPFRQYIELEGCKDGMEGEVDLTVEDTDYSIINGEQVELRLNLGARCEVFSRKILNIISNIEELEGDLDLESRASLTIYYIQPGDTLWKIAKKYYTTVEKIIETNKIEDPTAIKVGDHIIIEKVHNFLIS